MSQILSAPLALMGPSSFTLWKSFSQSRTIHAGGGGGGVRKADGEVGVGLLAVEGLR